MDDRRDEIEAPISDGIDLLGWDLRTALKRLRKSNPSLQEWIKSPIGYRADPTFALLFGLLATEFPSTERSFRHDLHRARGNCRADLRSGQIRLKKISLRAPAAARLPLDRAGARPGADAV